MHRHRLRTNLNVTSSYLSPVIYWYIFLGPHTSHKTFYTQICFSEKRVRPALGLIFVRVPAGRNQNKLVRRPPSIIGILMRSCSDSCDGIIGSPSVASLKGNLIPCAF